MVAIISSPRRSLNAEASMVTNALEIDVAISKFDFRISRSEDDISTRITVLSLLGVVASTIS